jgi:hypothetical protein
MPKLLLAILAMSFLITVTPSFAECVKNCAQKCASVPSPALVIADEIEWKAMAPRPFRSSPPASASYENPSAKVTGQIRLCDNMGPFS